MSDTTNALLRQAYTLIEDDQLEKAQEILAPLLEEDAENAHLWWVYSHAVQDNAVGMAALERVLELDPQYPGARELKTDAAEAQALDPDLIAFEAVESESDDPATPLAIDDWEDLQPVADVEADGSSSRIRAILVVALLIVVVAGALVISGAVDLNDLLAGILTPSQPQVIVVSEATSEPTVVAIEVEAGPAIEMETTEPLAVAATQDSETSEPVTTASATATEPTATETPAATDTPAATATASDTPEPTPTIDSDSIRIDGFVGLLAGEIDEFTVDRTASGTLPTDLGKTLVIRACAIPGPELQERLKTVLTTVAALTSEMPEDIEAAAAGLINCDDEDASLRIIGVARGVIDAFANDEIEMKDFQRAWQPLY